MLVLTGIARCLTRLSLALLLTWVSMANVARAHESTFIEQGDRYLELVVSADFNLETRQAIEQWARFLSQSLLQVYGRWPRQHWRMTVAPASASAEDPIPWAQVIRGDINTVEFFISPQSTQDRLAGAWTGYHELGHLLIPYRGWGDLWFSEGLATYYQNILQARMGLLSEREMWQNIYGGLLRGIADNRHQDLTLQEVSATLHTQGGFMRTYWSGARYFLELDIRLRRQSGGRITLDTALEKLNQCCADDTLSAAQIVRKLDDLNKLTLFESLYQSTRERKSVAPFQTLFTSLGITLTDGRVSLQPVGPGADLRRQIAKTRTLPLAPETGILAH